MRQLRLSSGAEIYPPKILVSNVALQKNKRSSILEKSHVPCAAGQVQVQQAARCTGTNHLHRKSSADICARKCYDTAVRCKGWVDRIFRRIVLRLSRERDAEQVRRLAICDGGY